jgi:hypothetical protein
VAHQAHWSLNRPRYMWSLLEQRFSDFSSVEPFYKFKYLTEYQCIKICNISKKTGNVQCRLMVFSLFVG